jgi:hypothetical protein
LARLLGISKKVYQNNDKTISQLEIFIDHVTSKLAHSRSKVPIPTLATTEMATKVDSRFMQQSSRELNLSDCDGPIPQKVAVTTINDFHSSEDTHLASLLFANTNSRFPEEWKGKGFQYQEAPGVTYGLVQLKVFIFNNREARAVYLHPYKPWY